MSRYEEELSARSLGVFGGQRIDGDGHATGDFCGIHALTDTTIKAGTIGNIENVVGAVVTQGDSLLGEFTVIHASGSAVFYNKK